MFFFIALISGLLFGMGMALSGMVIPEVVLAFLDVAGNWKPDLAFVMGGALLVFLPCYFLIIKPCSKPVYSKEFAISNKQSIDKRLIVGASIFGLGWGLGGICPGPVVSSLASGNSGAIVFFLFMMLGLFVTKKWIK
ncbi:YeeE/YedE family protein [Vibrio sp. SS-MA-C1-2]|uniref:YeeE/YedE family protein n=1 Tax=Vibrio sp. SS-MA-C1-2 TaxID=2908646 RepID=UPI001F251190|nr:YeeE/YedE family protein [Vibrio sp. SS-MA-C1-2]UJF17105.1 YeeE/YedE family protein [Vibrio sp. SS-MA-C1-2]